MTGWWAIAFVVQWLLLATLAIVVVALARQIGVLHLRLGPRGALEIDTEGPALGERPAPLRARAADGSTVQVGGPGEGRLLLFSSPTCPVCAEVAPAVPVAAAAAGLRPQIVHDEHAEAALEVPGTPFAVVLDEEGVVRAKGTPNTLEQLEGLVDSALRRIEEQRWAS